VLVIIGLLVGGVLVGRDLINAATIRAQISQIEKYQTAVRTFQGKYGYLPGDIPASPASQFGFLPRDNTPACSGAVCSGGGDWNGIIEATDRLACGYICGNFGISGEVSLFWEDLSKAGLIEGSFSQLNLCCDTSSWLISDVSNNGASPSTMVKDYFPSAKIGYGYIVINSGGIEYNNGWTPWDNSNGKNYFSTFSMNYFGTVGGFANANGSMGDVIFTPAQAYAIDKKTDDGLPQSGKITAMIGGGWAINTNNPSALLTGDCDNPNNTCTPVTDTRQTHASIYTCYDNDYNGNNGGTEHYSTNAIAVNNLNCGLSWEFQ